MKPNRVRVHVSSYDCVVIARKFVSIQLTFTTLG